MENKLPETRKVLENIKPYVPGKPIEEVERELGIRNVIKMASNENPLGPSPKALQAIKEAMANVNLYPDGATYHLKQEIALNLALDPAQIIVGNGSDEVIKLTAETFINPGDQAIIAKPTFSEYEFAVTLMGGECVKIECFDFRHDLKAMLKAVTSKTKVVFICNPNNPTGTIVTRSEIEDFMSKLPDQVLAVFDEAYYEYVDHPEYMSGLELVRQGRKNVIVLRTFSKIYGLAGLRVGYGLAHPQLIACLSKAREPFNVNFLAQIGARAALQDKEFVERSRRENAEGKEFLYRSLQELGLNFVASQANFIWVNLNRDCRPVFEALLKEGVIIRTGDIFGYPEHIRVTVGTAEQNERFVKALQKVLNSF